VVQSNKARIPTATCTYIRVACLAPGNTWQVCDRPRARSLLCDIEFKGEVAPSSTSRSAWHHRRPESRQLRHLDNVSYLLICNRKRAWTKIRMCHGRPRKIFQKGRSRQVDARQTPNKNETLDAAGIECIVGTDEGDTGYRIWHIFSLTITLLVEWQRSKNWSKHRSCRTDLINSEIRYKKSYAFSWQGGGVRTDPTHLVCLRHCPTLSATKKMFARDCGFGDIRFMRLFATILAWGGIS